MSISLAQLQQDLVAMQARAKDPSKILRHISNLMAASVDRNFELEGRPRWTPVKASTYKRKSEAGKTKTLMWSGNLARSIVAQVDGTSVILGTNVRYARIHQSGGVIHRKAGSITARFRLGRKGDLLSQQELMIGPRRMRNASKMRVFAKSSHKRAVEQMFTHAAYNIQMPARPYLVFQPGEPEAYAQLILQFIATGGVS